MRRAAGVLIRLAVPLVLMATLLPASARAADDPNAWTASATYITSADGTPLRTWVYRPKLASGRTPVILGVGPYAGSGGSLYFSGPEQLLNDQVPPDPDGFPVNAKIFQRGYSLVLVGLRGYGGSGGCTDFGGKGEQADVKAAVEWAASRSWSTGKVGMYGHSYDAETQMMALRTRPKGLAAIIATAPPTGYRNIYTNGVRNFGLGTLGPAFYVGSDMYPASLLAPPEEQANSLTGTATNPDCYVNTIAGARSDDEDSAYWKERDLLRPNIGSTVPTLYAQGFNDYNVRPTSFLPEVSTLNGPHRTWVGPWYHGIPNRNGPEFTAEMVAWFDRWLKGIVGPDKAPVSVQDIHGRWRAEEDWPPPDVAPWSMQLLPGAYVNAPGNNGETELPDAFPTTGLPLQTGRGVWAITQPLPHAVHIGGITKVTAKVDATGPANVIAFVYDIDPSNVAHFLIRGATKTDGAGTVSFPLYPQDWRFEPGHRIGVMLTGADDLWFEPNGVPQQVAVQAASITFPVLRFNRNTFIKGPFRPRTPTKPFDVSPETIAASDVQAPLPKAPAVKPSACSPKTAGWWSTKTGATGYGAVASRAARRSFGRFTTGAAVTAALGGSSTRDFAALLLDMAAADIGAIGFGRLEPGARLSNKTYATSVVGDTVRAASFWIKTHLGQSGVGKVAATITSGAGISCP